MTEDGIEYLWNARPDLLMINGAGKPPGSDAVWMIDQDFIWYIPLNSTFASENEKALIDLIAKSPTAKRIRIGWPGMSNPTMRNLIRLKRLSHLEIGNVFQSGPDGKKLGVQIDALGWQCLCEAKELRVLLVHEVPLDEAALTGIGKLTQLRTLLLLSSEATDAGVRHFANLQNLNSLSLVSSRITDVSLKELAHLKRLQILDIRQTPIAGDGLKYLAALPELRTLYLDGTDISDAGLRHLAGIKNLKWLHIRSTKVTEKGVQWLQQARADIHITR